MVPTASYLNNASINPTGNENPSRGDRIQGVGVGAEKRTQLLATNSRTVEVSNPSADPGHRVSAIPADGSVPMFTPEKTSNTPNTEPIAKSPDGTNASPSSRTLTNVSSVIAQAQAQTQTLASTSTTTVGATGNNESDHDPRRKISSHQHTSGANKSQNQIQIQNKKLPNSTSSFSHPSLPNVSSLSNTSSASKNTTMHNNSPSRNRLSGAAAEPIAGGVGSETSSNSCSTPNREKVITITSTTVNSDANTQGSKISLQPNPHLEATWVPGGRGTKVKSASQDTSRLQRQPQSQAQPPLQSQNKRKRGGIGEENRLGPDSPSRNTSVAQLSASSIVSPNLPLFTNSTKAINEATLTSKMDVRGNANLRSTPSDMEIDSDDMPLKLPLDTIQTRDTGTTQDTEPSGGKPSSNSIVNGITDTSKLLSEDVASVSALASKSQPLEVDNEPSNAQTVAHTYQSSSSTKTASQTYPATTLDTATKTALPCPRNDPAFGSRVDHTLRDLVTHTAIDSNLVLRLAKELQETKKKLSEAEAKKNEITSGQEVGVPSDWNITSNIGWTSSVLVAQLQQKEKENNELHQRLSSLEQHYRSAVQMNQAFEIEITAIRSALSGKEKDLQTFAEKCQQLEADVYRTQQERSILANHCKVLQNRILQTELNRSASHGTLTRLNTSPFQSPINSPTSASGSSGLPAVHQHGRIHRTISSHPTHSETSTTPTQSPRQTNLVPPPAGAGPVSDPYVKAGSTGTAPAQSRLGSPIVAASPGYAVGQQDRGRNSGAHDLQLQRQPMEIARERYIPAPQRRSSMPLQQQQQQQQYSAIQHQTQFRNQQYAVQEQVIIHHERIQTQQLHIRTPHNWAAQTMNAFSQPAGGPMQLQTEHPPLSVSRRHSHPPVVNSVPSQHGYVPNMISVGHVQSFSQNEEQYQQNRHTSSSLSTPSTSSVPLTTASQRAISSGSVTPTWPSPSFPQNVGQAHSMPPHIGRQNEPVITQAPVMTTAFVPQLMSQPQGLARSHNPQSVQRHPFVPSSPSQPLVPSQAPRTHANNVSGHPIPHPPSHSSQIPYSFVMPPNQVIVQNNTQTWSQPPPIPQVSSTRPSPRSHQPQMVKHPERTTTVDSPLPTLPEAVKATVIDLTLDETEAEEPPKKKQKIEETKQNEVQDVVSAPVSLDHSLGEKVVDKSKVEGDHPAPIIDELDAPATSTAEVVATGTDGSAALPPSSQPLIINGLDISDPEIIETLTQAFEVPSDDPSARCCLFCRLRHEDDDKEWPQITRFKDPTVEDKVNHLKEIHTSVWQSLISGNFEDGEQ